MNLPCLSKCVAIGIAQLAATAALCTRPCAAQTTFSVGGPGGTIPASGTGGGGTWPSSLPPSPFLTQASSDVPVNACRFTRVSIAFGHSYVGDLQIVLISPRGDKFNIVHRPGFNGTGSGSGGDAAGGYFIERLGTPNIGDIPNSGDWTTGFYAQSYGQGSGKWPQYSAGVENVDLDEIPAIPGLWSLAIYDWASQDVGQVVGWNLDGLCGLPYVMTGGGGSIPASGTGGGGTWPDTLPPYPFEVTLMPKVGTRKLDYVSIAGLTHTYIGDLHFVLALNANVAMNLVCRPGFGSGTSLGSDGDCTGGLYRISSNLDPTAANIPVTGNWPAGKYMQFHGSWPSAAGVFQISLWDWLPDYEPIKLRIYDWAGSDTGSCTSTGIYAHYLPPEPRTYCTPSTTTNGCRPWITATATPSVSYANSCFVTVSNVEGQKNGLIFYGVSGRIESPWSATSTSTMCVAPPKQRTGVHSSGGTSDSCNGSLVLDWNQYRSTHPSALGQPMSLGQKVWMQAWFRDPPAPKTTNLSNALELVHVP